MKRKKEENRKNLTGVILKERYCILEPVGAGGNGRLYLARDLELGSFWAVKEIPLSQKREAKLLRTLEHPNLPRMVDYVEKGDFCYLVMEYIRGKSLAEWMARGRRFSMEEILDFGITAAQVLSYLHARKPPVFYGDLKPENLMLTGQGRLYLVDFGSAVFGYGSGRSLCQGTKGYAAPEQFEGRMSRASDVYALGRTMERLFGQWWLWKALKAPGLAAFLFRCCRRDEKRRLSGMEEAARRLQRIRQGYGKGQYAVKAFLISTTALFLLAGALLYFGREPDFWQTLTQVTEIYYSEEFLEGTPEERKTISARVNQRLQKMLQDYTDERQQEYLLRLLEAGRDLEEDKENES